MITKHPRSYNLKMGNNPYRQEELATYLPPLEHYSLLHAGTPLSIYRHAYNAEEIMEYQEIIHTKENVDRKLQTFYARYQHPYLVSTQYLKVEESETCTEGTFTLRIFYQRAVTNLSKVNDLPFSDSLHCYLVALKGFEILYKSYGYFQVFENMFHVCQKGKLKVWCNQHIFKSVPEQYLLGEGREEDMVIKIISIIDNNTDISSRTFNIKNELLKDDRLTFASAIVNFRRICRQHRFMVSEYIESLQNASQIESLLDIYIPQNKNQKYFDTGLTFNPSKNKQASNPVSTQDYSNRRRSKIFPQERTPERFYSCDITNSSQRKQQKMDLTIGNRAKGDGFPEFGVRNVNKTLSSSRIRASSPRRLDPSIVYRQQPTVQVASKLYRYDSRQTNLKKRGPREIPRYPEKILYESKVNKVGESSPSVQIKIRQPSPRLENQSIKTSQYVSIGNSGRNMIPQHNNILQERPAALRSHSENSIYRQPQRITFSQPKPNPIMIQQAIQTPIRQQPMIYKASPSPRIIFNTNPQQPSNLRKSSRAAPFIPPNVPQNVQRYNVPNQIHAQQHPSQQRNVVFNSVSHQETPNIISYSPSQYQRPSTPMTPVTQFTQLETRQNNHLQTRPFQGKTFEQAAKFVKEVESIPQSRLSGSIASIKRQKVDSKSFGKRPQTSFKDDSQQLPMGVVNIERYEQPKRFQPKVEKTQLSQLQSKIFMLESFATNKILTTQFLNNQSHALSNVKWEKGSNSGHDSVTSAFRQELLQENSQKPSLNQYQVRKVQSYGKKEDPILTKYDYDLLQTDPKLLQLIKTPAKPSGTNYNDIYQTEKKESYDFYMKKDYFQEKNNNFEPSYGKAVLQPFKKIEECKYGDSCNSAPSQYAKRNSESVQLTNQPYSYLDTKSFKKKTEPLLNKASAITQKWEEENYCSTSHGSTGNGKNYLQNLDPDLLEDMVAYGIDSKGKMK